MIRDNIDLSIIDKFLEVEEVNKPNKIIIHHSATEDGKVLSSFNAIKKYHMETNGWNDIGYHYVIEYVKNVPTIQKGRDDKTVGAHTVGQNSQSIGICVVGNFDKTVPDDAIIDKLVELIKDIRIYNGYLPIHYHNEFANKTCPGKFFFDKFRLEEMTLIPTKKVTQEPIIPTKEWQRETLDKLVQDGLINSPDYWLNKWEDNIKVKDVIGLVGNLLYRVKE